MLPAFNLLRCDTFLIRGQVGKRMLTGNPARVGLLQTSTKQTGTNKKDRHCSVSMRWTVGVARLFARVAVAVPLRGVAVGGCGACILSASFWFLLMSVFFLVLFYSLRRTATTWLGCMLFIILEVNITVALSDPWSRPLPEKRRNTNANWRSLTLGGQVQPKKRKHTNAPTPGGRKLLKPRMASEEDL